jgi:drug/metabolite transporter (DMT)-like permease
MSATQVVVSLVFIPFVSVPSIDSWPYLIASSVFNTGYMLMLNRAYGTGDLSLIYPIARGVAPLAVAVVSIAVLGENLSYANQGAVLLIGLGITSLALTQRPTRLIDLRPFLLALATGAFIAAYTIVDGLGARASGSAHGYVIWLSLVTSILIVGCLHWLQQGRGWRVAQRTRTAGIAAGMMSYASSWVVIWALTLAPLALVSALRETGVVFAVIIGVAVLKEPLSLSRLASVAATLLGTAILKLGR